MQERIKFMRVFVLFDLPTTSAVDRKRYRKFRKYLIKEGFIMMQESVYCKLAVSEKVVPFIKNKLRKNKPKHGSVAVLVITEKQYADIEYITGEKCCGEYIDTTDSVVFL